MADQEYNPPTTQAHKKSPTSDLLPFHKVLTKTLRGVQGDLPKDIQDDVSVTVTLSDGKNVVPSQQFSLKDATRVAEKGWLLVLIEGVSYKSTHELTALNSLPKAATPANSSSAASSVMGIAASSLGSFRERVIAPFEAESRNSNGGMLGASERAISDSLRKHAPKTSLPALDPVRVR